MFAHWTSCRWAGRQEQQQQQQHDATVCPSAQVGPAWRLCLAAFMGGQHLVWDYKVWKRTLRACSSNLGMHTCCWTLQPTPVCSHKLLATAAHFLTPHTAGLVAAAGGARLQRQPCSPAGVHQQRLQTQHLVRAARAASLQQGQLAAGQSARRGSEGVSCQQDDWQQGCGSRRSEGTPSSRAPVNRGSWQPPPSVHTHSPSSPRLFLQGGHPAGRRQEAAAALRAGCCHARPHPVCAGGPLR